MKIIRLLCVCAFLPGLMNLGAGDVVSNVTPTPVTGDVQLCAGKDTCQYDYDCVSDLVCCSEHHECITKTMQAASQHCDTPVTY